MQITSPPGNTPAAPRLEGRGTRGASLRRISGYLLSLWPVSGLALMSFVLFMMVIKNPGYFGVIMNVSSKHMLIAVRTRLCAIHVAMQTRDFRNPQAFALES